MESPGTDVTLVGPRAGAMRTVRWSRRAVLWMVVLGVMAAFQLWRGAYTDGVLFTMLVAMLVTDAVTGGRVRILRRPLLAPRWIILAITIFLGVLLVAAPRHSFVDWLTVVAVGLLVLALAWGPKSSQDSGQLVGGTAALRHAALLWSIFAVGFCVWEALAFVMGTLHGGDFASYPTISFLMDPILENIAGRALFVAFWLATGLALTRLWGRK